MYNLKIEKIDFNTGQRLDVERFLSAFNLFLDKDVDCTVVAKDKDEIVGTCSYAGKIIKCFAVKKGLQGEGIASKLITYITNDLFDKGIYETFIFTKPQNYYIFQDLNYHEVYATKEVVLLEGGMANVKRYVKGMYKESGLGEGKKAALVMNCNPFTLGHRYLIERASRENTQVVVFIVEENRSLFPFEVRVDLVKRGTKDLKNVHIVAGGDYIISSATFPSYFLRQEDERLKAYAKLDAGIFGKYISPVFHIDQRYVGTEPYCNVTKKYNDALLHVLPRYDIKVEVLQRFQQEGRAVSASEVRRLIKLGDWDKLKRLVPKTTYDFLISSNAKDIIERIKRSDSPH
jgi:[citrate (pro-3S)-lyase] ligase